jgi:hypothetical protein
MFQHGSPKPCCDSFRKSERTPIENKVRMKKITDRRLRFRAVIEINGINPYVPVRSDHAGRLKNGWRRPMPVRVQINGKPETPWRINLMPMGNGDFFLYLHEQVRKASNTRVGDIVTVTLAFDHDYRGGPAHPMPPWFGDELKRNPDAQEGWDNLTPSRQKEILRYFVGLKSSAAQQRNVVRALHVLAGGKGRFMARDWKGGK